MTLELKSEAYADYVNSIAALAPIPPNERRSERYDAATEKHNAAKWRLCVFADEDVIEQMVRLNKTSLNLGLPDAQKEFVALLQCIRATGFAVGKVRDEALRTLFFGNESSC